MSHSKYNLKQHRLIRSMKKLSLSYYYFFSNHPCMKTNCVVTTSFSRKCFYSSDYLITSQDNKLGVFYNETVVYTVFMHFNVLAPLSVRPSVIKQKISQTVGTHYYHRFVCMTQSEQKSIVLLTKQGRGEASTERDNA